MQDTIEAFAAGASACASLAEVSTLFSAAVARHGYTVSAAGAFLPAAKGPETHFFFQNWPAEWIALYQERNFVAADFGATKEPIVGRPADAHISTSYVERQNLTMRMSMRRFTRLTNAFSKKVDNHIHMLSLYFVHCNFCRIHKTLRMSPAMAAGIDSVLRDMEGVVGLIDAIAPAPAKRGPYKKAPVA